VSIPLASYLDSLAGTVAYYRLYPIACHGSSRKGGIKNPQSFELEGEGKRVYSKAIATIQFHCIPTLWSAPSLVDSKGFSPVCDLTAAR